MGEDRERTDRSKDEDSEAQRHIRFGTLPARVAPEDLVETADTDLPHDEPGPPQVRREWG